MLAMELGLVSLGHVSLDGSKFKASSSKHKAMSHQWLVKKEKELMMVNSPVKWLVNLSVIVEGEDFN